MPAMSEALEPCNANGEAAKPAAAAITMKYPYLPCGNCNRRFGTIKRRNKHNIGCKTQLKRGKRPCRKLRNR